MTTTTTTTTRTVAATAKTRRIYPFRRNECNVKMHLKKSIAIIQIPARINQICVCVCDCLLDFRHSSTERAHAHMHKPISYEHTLIDTYSVSSVMEFFIGTTSMITTFLMHLDLTASLYISFMYWCC